MKQAGKVYYSRLQVFGGSCVALGGEWVLTCRHGTERWSADALRVRFPALGDEKYRVKRVVLCQDADLALFELQEPVKDAEELAVYPGGRQRGKRAWIGGFGLSGPTGHLETVGAFRAGHNRIDGIRREKLSISLSKPDAADCESDEALPATFDSGSPLFLKTEDGWRLAGIASTASNRSKPTYGDRGNYARVAPQVDWLQEVMASDKRE